jgi:hypothetical protein
MARMLSACLAAAVLMVPAFAHAQDAAAADPFLGADGCKTCHTEIAASWAKTKHARAMDSLSGNDRTNAACVTCHITAQPGTVADQLTRPHHPNVQCEACHGAGRAHAERAATGTPALAGMVKVPAENVCTGCHNARSPSFKGFFYTGMKSLVHKH